MGYPMTWRRVVGRNSLTEGDYHNSGSHGIYINLGFVGIKNPDKTEEVRTREYHADMGPEFIRTIKSNEERWKALLGDLRRLEADVMDEGSICQHVASRTGVDADTVAAVLKEFLNF